MSNDINDTQRRDMNAPKMCTMKVGNATVTMIIATTTATVIVKCV